MAVTFTATTPINKQVSGTEACGRGVKITCSGTTSDNGDTLSPGLFGLTKLTSVVLHSGATVDSESNPENGFVLALAQPSVGTFNVIFLSQAVAGATTPLAAITDGTSVANHVFYATGYGKP